MKLSEAWHLSRIPYGEAAYRSIAEERGRMWWGSFGRSDPDKVAEANVELTKRALRIAKFDKLVVAVFNVIASVIPFTVLFFGSPVLGLTSSISLSLATTFGFTTLYAIQTLSSFVSAEPSALLNTLPLAKDEFSLITLFSYIRSVDYMVVASILSQVTLVAYLTASPLATLLMFAAATMNAVFAVTIALWFSRLFYRSLSRGGRSKSRTALRIVFILMWGSLLMGVGLLLSVPWYIVPQLGRALLNLNPISNMFFCIFYPFSSGIAISSLVHPTATFSTALTAFVAMAGYVALAGAALRWSLGTVRHMSQGTGVKVVRETAKEFSVKVRNPSLGYVMKDLKITSRNPATAFFFAFPVFETVIVSLLITNYELLRTSTILVATTMGGIFALLMPLALLNAEGTGLEYTKTLPVNSSRIITSKTLISTAAYLPVPLALLAMTFMKPSTSPITILIPYITILAIASASIIEIRLFLGFVTQGRIATLINDLEKLIAGVIIMLIPEVAYVTTYLISVNHISAILIMGGTAFAELAMAVHLLKRP
jgi:predicted permease